MALAQDNGHIKLEGRLDMARCAELAPQITEAGTRGSLVLDLAGVSTVDSAALALCLHGQRQARANGHRFSIANPPASLLSLAHLYGADDLLPVESTR